MFGSTVNGNIQETIIVGGRDPGSNPERAGHTNQDIGKTTKRDINGIKVPGSDKSKVPEIEKPRLGRGFLNKGD
jgi:hypothetical protein